MYFLLTFSIFALKQLNFLVMINYSEFEVVIPSYVSVMLGDSFIFKIISPLCVSCNCSCIRKGYSDDFFESVEYLFSAPSIIAPFLRNYLISFSKLLYSSASASERSRLSWSFGEIRNVD